MKGLSYVILSAIAWSITNVIMKRMKVLSASDFGAIRYAVILICMLIVIKAKKLVIFESWAIIRLLVLRGALGAILMLLMCFAIMLMRPSDAATLVHTSLLITAILSRIFLGEKLTIAQLIGIPITIVGVLFISKPSFLFSYVTAENSKDFNSTITEQAAYLTGQTMLGILRRLKK